MCTSLPLFPLSSPFCSIPISCPPWRTKNEHTAQRCSPRFVVPATQLTIGVQNHVRHDNAAGCDARDSSGSVVCGKTRTLSFRFQIKHNKQPRSNRSLIDALSIHSIYFQNVHSTNTYPTTRRLATTTNICTLVTAGRNDRSPKITMYILDLRRTEEILTLG